MTISLALAWLAAGDDSDASPSGRGGRKRVVVVDVSPRANAIPDDEDIARATRVRAGDERAFDEVYLEYFTALTGFAASYVHDMDAANDIVQDVFRRIWEHRSAFAPRGAIRAYLYGAVRNGAFNYRRHERVAQQNKRTNEHAVNVMAGVGEQPVTPDAALQASEALANVVRVLAELPDDRRRLLSLRWQHQLSYGEIAAILGVSEQVARAQVSRIARRLRAIIDEAM